MNKKQFTTSDFFIFSGFLVFGLVAFILPSSRWFSGIPGDYGDARFNIVILEHLYGWVTGKWGSLWSPSFFFPYEGVLGFSDNHFGSAWSYILLRILGLDSEHSFSAWYSIGCTLNFISAYWIFRKFKFSSFASAAGAFVYSFSLPFLAQTGHAQLAYRFAIPPAFYACWKVMQERRAEYVGQMFFWTVIQFFCSIYLGVFLVYLMTSMFIANFILGKRKLLISLVFSFRSSLGSQKLTTLFAILISSFALLLLLASYKLISLDYGFNPGRGQIADMLPRLSSYLIADGSILSSWVGSWVDGIPFRNEHQLFFGIGVSILALLGARLSWKKPLQNKGINYQEQAYLGKLASISFCLLFLVTLKVGAFGLYHLPAIFPGIKAIRAVSRIILLMSVPVSICVAIFCENILDLKSPTKKYLLIITVLFLLGLEVYFFRLQTISNWEIVNREVQIEKLLPKSIDSNSVLYVTKRKDEPFFLAELDGMMVSQKLGIPTLNGYSGQFPRGIIEPDPCKSFKPRLERYALFRDKSELFVGDMAKRVIVVSPEKCTQ